MEDTHIINLFLERSEDAIRQVEVKYEKFCFKIAWNILYNTEDSEECVNDTWLITWNKIPPKPPTKFSAFLGKIPEIWHWTISERKMLQKEQIHI